MKPKSYTFLLIFLVFIAVGCKDGHNNHYALVLREQREKPIEKSKQEQVDQALLKANQVINEKELQQIKGYIERRKWGMKKLSTGVFVEQLSKGKGKTINSNSIVSIDCKIELLDGKKVYDSKIDGLKQINFGKEQSVIGLIYALNNMNEGTKLRAIIPSFLAYGLNGDGDRIPKRSSLVYEIEIKEVK